MNGPGKMRYCNISVTQTLPDRLSGQKTNKTLLVKHLHPNQLQLKKKIRFTLFVIN